MTVSATELDTFWKHKHKYKENNNKISWNSFIATLLFLLNVKFVKI